MLKKRYNTFTIGRPGYWGLLLLIALINIAIDATARGDLYIDEAEAVAYFWLGFALLVALFTLSAARCRDAGLNGWWSLVIIIPLVSIYYGCIRPDDHPKKLRAFEKLRVNESDLLDLPTLDAPKAPEDGHTLIDIPNSKE